MSTAKIFMNAAALRTYFLSSNPWLPSRHVEVTLRRTKTDYARILRWLAKEVYPDAEYIRLVQDHLNTHLPASLYEAFEPEEARRLAQRFEFHDTPKHGSWLNMVEIEIGIFERGCLSRRIPDTATLQQHVAALEAERNAHRSTIHWRFTAPAARSKLERLSPHL